MIYLLEFLFGIYLGILSIIDIKNKQLPILVLLLEIVFVPLFIFLPEELTIGNHILGVIPGIVFLIISWASRGQVGLADCWVVLLTGLSLGISLIVSILAVSFIAIALAAMGMLVVKKLNRKSSLPYIPFIFLGYVLSIGLF